ncbi:MAG: TIGR03752 family integrating conjugative element protein [Gammaproteobacteria bacterium]|nr:TIGR03752 family integrating conjugative element protein [Gammaproteobacteria bacterium]
MPWKFNNKLIPVISVLAVLGVMFIVVKSCNNEVPQDPVMNFVPESPAPDADSPADTIKTLTANVGELISEVDALRQDHASLREERDDIEANIARQFAAEFRNLRQERNLNASTPNDWQRIQDRIEEISSALEALARDSVSDSYQIGSNNITGIEGIDAVLSPSYVWLNPLDTEISGSSFGGLSSEANIDPVITIPINATLIDSTALTALIGRVPANGRVQDPMPFKVLTGDVNLAANGATIEDIEGMMWSGWAVGDWTLSCVSGYVDSVTFVFSDGTIHSIESTQSSGDSSQALGWISDPYGNPCIPGERKSNASSYLLQQSLLNTSMAASDTAAALETTQSLSPVGAIQSLVTGDASRYVLGNTLAGGLQSTSDWLTRRAEQEFDAVLLPAGHKVAIHVEQELQINYDREGRKLNHDQDH